MIVSKNATRSSQSRKIFRADWKIPLFILKGGIGITLNANKQNSNNIIHKSGWAISKKSGNKVHKIFLHDSYLKIQKEVSLLQLSSGKEANLSFDSYAGRWICESDYLELRPVIANIHLNKFITQLREKFSIWKDDRRYHDLISDEWSECVIPWYCMLLQQYIPDSDELIIWLQDSKGEHFVHGDFTLSNIYLDQSNNVVVLDYENATFGPLLWDETTLVYSFIEQKQFHLARQLYAAFPCKKEMLQAICSIRLAQSLKKKQNIKQRTEAYEYIIQNY